MPDLIVFGKGLSPSLTTCASAGVYGRLISLRSMNLGRFCIMRTEQFFISVTFKLAAKAQASAFARALAAIIG